MILSSVKDRIIRRSENIFVQKLTITHMTYDGIYVGYNSHSITIDDVACIKNTRQAMSVTSVSNLDIRNSKFNDSYMLKITDSNGVTRDSCGNGLIFEVNEREPLLEAISIDNCEFINNQVGLSISTSKATSKAKDISFTIENCLSKDNKILQVQVSEWAKSPEESVGGYVNFDNVTADGLNPININMGLLNLTFNHITAKISDTAVSKNNTAPLVKVVQTIDSDREKKANFTFNGDVYSDNTQGKCNRIFAYSTKNNLKSVNTIFSGESKIVKSDGDICGT